MVNEVQLIGNAGRDAELKTSASGSQYATFSLATSERFRGHDGEWREDTEWHKIKVIGKSADRIARQIRKGDKVYVSGKIASYETDGVRRTEIKSFRVINLNKREESPSPYDLDNFIMDLSPVATAQRPSSWGAPQADKSHQAWNPSKAQWK